MGCGNSRCRDGPLINNPTRNKNGQKRLPEVVIEVGAGVKGIDPLQTPHIIFIFGGPGSLKGRIVQNLIEKFGFVLISVERLIFEALPSALGRGETVEDTNDLRSILRDEPGLVTLQWVLQVISNRIDQDKKSSYLIDIVPNLKFLLRIETLIKENTDDEMKEFENKHKCLFALNMIVSEDAQIPNSKSERTDGGGDSQSDEVDFSRTKKRQQLYDSCSKPFLDYFLATDRNVIIDVSCGIADHIWRKINEYFIELKFSSHRRLVTIIFFGLESSDLENENLEAYGMKTIILSHLVNNSDAPADTLLQCLRDKIDSFGHKSENFAIDMTSTRVTSAFSQQPKKRAITFLDVEVASMDKFILPKCHYTLSKPKDIIKYKAIFCPSTNEICMFPLRTSTELCRNLAASMFSLKPTKDKDEDIDKSPDTS